MRKLSLLAVALVAGLFMAGAGGCSSPAPKESGEQATLASESSTALDGFKKEDPTLNDLLGKAVGYAIFPEVGKAGFIAGGSYGNGEVFEGGKKIGYADITQATFGLQAGAQHFNELILFLRQDELNQFKESQFSLAGNVGAVANKSGAAKTADTSKGVVVFVKPTGGAMAEASVGGQRFRFSPLKASTTRPAGG